MQGLAHSAVTRLARVAALALLGASVGARAEVYLGGTLDSAGYGYSDVDNGSGSQAFLGYRVDGFPMMVEVSSFTAGHAKIHDYRDPNGDTFTDGKLGFKGTNYSIGYFGSAPQIRLGWWGKLGYYTGKASLSGVTTISGASNAVSDEQDCDGLSLGIGAQYKFTPWFGALLRVEGFERVNDYKDFDNGHKGAVSFVGAGLVFSFPPFVETPEMRPAPRHHEARRPAPVVAQPLEPSPPPSAPAVAAPAAGETRLLPAGFLLRGRPLPDADGVRLASDTPVALATRLESPEGAWWFVRAEKSMGWIPEKDLPARTRQEPAK